VRGPSNPGSLKGRGLKQALVSMKASRGLTGQKEKPFKLYSALAQSPSSLQQLFCSITHVMSSNPAMSNRIISNECTIQIFAMLK
jgi:hypothetical protein